MTPSDTLPTNYFDDVYTNKDDPWDFETSDYEKNKYRVTVASLSKEKYDSGFEIGCSIGVLTNMLAEKCSKLLAVDASDLPLAKARARLAGKPQVTIRQLAIPANFPAEDFDLVVVSEVAYYFSMDDLRKTIDLIITHLRSGGQLILVHWTPLVPDYPLTGDQVHNEFRSHAGDGQPLQLLMEKREEKYRLDLFQKR